MPRVLVVGFDGAPPDLVDRFRVEGRMPALDDLISDGAYGSLRSTTPANSAVAWTSLVTGVRPGRHGIYDFVLPRTDVYGYRVTTRADRRSPAIWNVASEAGARVAVANIPMTFPAEKVNGFLVSGMDAPKLDRRAVYPGDLLDRMRASVPDYRIVSKAHQRAIRGDFEGVEGELVGALANRQRLVVELVGMSELDLVVVNLEATDGAHHFLWQHHDPSHPRHDPNTASSLRDSIGRVYAATDLALARILEAYRPDTVFVVSDHGGGPSSDVIVCMNDWLAQEGLLKLDADRISSAGRSVYDAAKRRLSVPARRRLRPVFGRFLERAKSAALYGDVDWTETHAYAHMQAAIRLNLKGREPRGIVDPMDAEAALEEIAARASALRLPNQQPAFPGVFRAPELYGGDAPGGPDLVLQPAAGLHIRGRNTSGQSGAVLSVADLGSYLPSGLHTSVGIVAASGKGVTRTSRADEHEVHQLVASVATVMGLETPQVDAPPFSFVEAQAVSRSIPGVRLSDGRHRPVEPAISQEEESEVLERLRGLGYVD